MNFSLIIEKLQDGYPIYRESWERDIFIFAQVPSNIDANIIENMTSLPNLVKEELIKRREKLPLLKYSNQLAVVYEDNSIQTYTLSPADIFADDWYIYDSNV